MHGDGPIQTSYPWYWGHPHLVTRRLMQTAASVGAQLEQRKDPRSCSSVQSDPLPLN